MTAGYSGTPLVKKLGIKPGYRMCAIEPPTNYEELLEGLPEDVEPVELADGEIDFVHIFATERKAAERHVAAARGRIVKNGMIWLSWPKRASGVATELNDNVVRTIGLDAGLVDIKVCAVDEIWSGLKFVIRVADRD